MSGAGNNPEPLTNLYTMALITTAKPTPAMGHPRIFYNILTPHDTPRTLIIHLEIINSVNSAVLEAQTHSLTMHTDRNSVVLRVTSDDGVNAREEILLLPKCVVCIDFIPRVFNSVYAMYAVSPDRVAIFMQPYAAKMGTSQRPVVEFQGGVFEDVWSGRTEIDPYDGNSKGNVEALHGALGSVFGSGVSMRWGFDQISPFSFLKEKVEEESLEGKMENLQVSR